MYKLVNILRETLQEKVSIDKETIAKFIKDNGITKKSTAEGSLYTINPTYYRYAQHMGWLDDLFPKETEEELYKKIENFIKDNNLKKPVDLFNAKRSYFDKAKTYNLIDKFFPKESDEELYKKIAKFIEDNNVTTFGSYKDNNSLRVANPYYFGVVGRKGWTKKLFPLNAKQLQAPKKQTGSRKFTSAQKDRFLTLGNKIKVNDKIIYLKEVK
jgi:DNA replication initiation complex subunit (GINS family)